MIKGCILHVIDLGLIPYPEALAIQESLLLKRQAGTQGDTLLLLEHPPVFTLGRNAKESNILVKRGELEKLGIGLFRTNRGGDVTYHGPGQVVGYPIINLKEKGLTVVAYVDALERVLAAALLEFGIKAAGDQVHRGVWVGREKIAAIGVRVSRQVTMHGVSLNVAVDMTHYKYIVPCGIADRGVTSVHILKPDVPMERAKRAVVKKFVAEFGYDGFEENNCRPCC